MTRSTPLLVALFVPLSGCGPNAHAVMQAGKDSFKARKYEEAKASFTKCLELDPNMAECHLALGSLLARERRPEDALVHYREFLRLEPNHERAKEVRILLKDYEDSLKSPAAGAQPAP
ncbi:MAG TPA: tetratricopeptide repeat protein [Myxococcaceae bacterium]|jgi:tetratricopeptide (TPR) repeat protein